MQFYLALCTQCKVTAVTSPVHSCIPRRGNPDVLVFSSINAHLITCLLTGAESTRRTICYNFDNINALVDTFMKMVDVLVTEIATLLVKFEGRRICLSTKSSSHMRVLELIEEIYLFWNKCSRPIQEAVSNALASNHPQTLRVFHTFLLKAMRGNL